MGLKVGEYKYLWEQRNVWNKVVLVDNQMNRIQRNFKKYYGKGYSAKWHRLYQGYTGKFDKDYFPEILFSTKLEPILNPRCISLTLEDKNLLEPLYQSVRGLRIPKTLLGNSGGVFYTRMENSQTRPSHKESSHKEMPHKESAHKEPLYTEASYTGTSHPGTSHLGNGRKIINYKEACGLISNTHYVVIKPSIGSHSGAGFMICKFHNGIDIITKRSCKDIVKSYKENFIVQELITNCQELKVLYGDALNTIRVITYILDDQLYHLPIALRLGCNGSKVDNIGAGGLFIGISAEGYLKPYAFAETGEKYPRHPNSNITFHRYYIPNIPKVLEMAYSCHLNTPQVKMVSWDFTIDENLDVVLIEANMLGQSLGFPQMANGKSAFGKNTKKMYTLIKKKGKAGRMKERR